MVTTDRRIAVGDTTLAVLEHGVGGHPLLVVHGFTGSKEDFTDWIDPIVDRGWHAVLPDLRGHGSSDAPDDEDAYSLETFAEDLVGLVDALGWASYTLLGHSMGGMIAQLVALRDPSRLRGLILMDTCHGPVDVDAELAALAISIARTEGIDALADAMAAVEGPLHTEAHARMLVEREGYAEFADRKFRASSPAMYATVAGEMLNQPDRLDDLRGFDRPTLVIVGEQDQPFIGPSRRMADALPNSEFALLPNGGHSPQFESPTAWWQAVSTFLEKLAGC